MVTRLAVLRTDELSEDLSLRWDRHERVSASASDTVTTALMRAGVLETSKSIKYRRPRGPFCLRGDCGTCLVRIDGAPNLRACMTPVRHGLRVDPQNRFVEHGPDPTALVDKMFAGGMDHHHFMVRPRLANKIMQSVARNLAGLGTLPDAEAPEGRVRRADVDVLVVGAGSAGRAVADALSAKHTEVMWVERRDAIAVGHPPPGTVWVDTAVFGIYPEEGLVGAITRRSTEPDLLHLIRPRHLVLAVGARDSMIALPGNDIPSVVSARGLLEQLERSRSRLAVPALVVGEGLRAQDHAKRLDVRCVVPSDVRAIEGGGAVERVRLKDETVACHLVALSSPPAPAFELGRQAGAAVHWNGRGFALRPAPSGQLEAPGPWTLWACGEVTGLGPEEAAASGRRVARAIASTPHASDRPRSPNAR